MIAVDTNILVSAHRPEAPEHAQALQWVRRLAEGEELWGLPVFCLAEFVRVTTHRQIFDPPSFLSQALAALSSLLESPSLRILTPGQRFPSLLLQSLEEADARGNLAFDAQIAALCLEQGASLLTLDQDFRRFGRLRLAPLESASDLPKATRRPV